MPSSPKDANYQRRQPWLHDVFEPSQCIGSPPNFFPHICSDCHGRNPKNLPPSHRTSRMQAQKRPAQCVCHQEQASRNERGSQQPAPPHCYTKTSERPTVDDPGCNCGSGCSECSQPKPKNTFKSRHSPLPEQCRHPSGPTQREGKRIKASYFSEQQPTPWFFHVVPRKPPYVVISAGSHGVKLRCSTVSLTVTRLRRNPRDGTH